MDEDLKEANRMTQLLHDEVLSKGYGASLPSALSDPWLQKAKESWEKMSADLTDGEDSDPEIVATSLLMLLVVCSLRDQGKFRSSQWIRGEDLDDYVHMYQTEVHVEYFRRKGLLKCAPATVENIFDPNREISCSGVLVDLMRHDDGDATVH